MPAGISSRRARRSAGRHGPPRHGRFSSDTGSHRSCPRPQWRPPLVRARTRADAAGRAALERTPRGRAHGARRRAQRGAAPRHRAPRRARTPLGRGTRRGRSTRIRRRDGRRSAAPEVRPRAEASRDDSRRRDDRHGEGSWPWRPKPRGRARGGPRDRGGSRHRDALRGDGRRRSRAGRSRCLRRRHDARRADALGLDPWRALLDNDTGPFFRALGDVFSPGPTGTNVGDVAFVLGPPVAEDDSPAVSRPA